MAGVETERSTRDGRPRGPEEIHKGSFGWGELHGRDGYWTTSFIWPEVECQRGLLVAAAPVLSYAEGAATWRTSMVAWFPSEPTSPVASRT